MNTFVSTLVVERALNPSKIIEIKPKIHQDALYELRKIGVNLNQITRTINKKFYDKEAMKVLDEVLDMKYKLAEFFESL